MEGPTFGPHAVPDPSFVAQWPVWYLIYVGMDGKLAKRRCCRADVPAYRRWFEQQKNLGRSQVVEGSEGTMWTTSKREQDEPMCLPTSEEPAQATKGEAAAPGFDLFAIKSDLKKKNEHEKVESEYTARSLDQCWVPSFQ